MLSPFYSYLDKKLYEFFNDNNLQPGDRFYLILNDEEEVVNLKLAIENSKVNTCKKFVSSEYNYNTIYYDIRNNDSSDLKIIFIFATDQVTHDFLVTVRNKVSLQEGEWENTVAVFLIQEDLDSITGGSFDLSKQGAPFHYLTLRNNLDNLVSGKNSKFKDSDKQIMKDAVNTSFEDSLAKYTLMDFEDLFSIIERGTLSVDDYKNLGLFYDKQLDTYNTIEVKKRIEQNKKIFEEISSYHDRGSPKEDLENYVDDSNIVSKLSKDNWFTLDYETVRKSKQAMDQLKRKNIEFLESDFLEKFKDIEVWDRPPGTTKAQRKERNIVIFKRNQNLDFIELPFSNDIKVNHNYVVKTSKKFLNLSQGEKINLKISSRSNKLKLDISEFDSQDTMYFEFNYKHDDNNALTIRFRILVVNFESTLIENISTNYRLKYDAPSNSVEFQIKSEESILKLNNNSSKIADIKSAGEHLFLNDFSTFNFNDLILEDENEIYIFLSISNIKFKFRLDDVVKKPVPTSSIKLLMQIYKNKQSLNFYQNKVIQGNKEFYINSSFRAFLNIEEDIISNYHLSYDINREGTTLGLDDLSPDIVDKYKNLLDLIKSKNTLPSLMYFDEEIIESAESYCESIESKLASLNDNEKIADSNIINLQEIGLIKNNDEIFLSILHPLILRYEIEKVKKIGDNSINEKVLKKYNPVGLMPYWMQEDTEYFSNIDENYIRGIKYKIYNPTNKTNSEKTSYIIESRMTEFRRHFTFLFDISEKYSLKARFIDMSNQKMIIQGVLKYLLEEIYINKTLNFINPVDVYIDTVENEDIIERFLNITSYQELSDLLEIQVKLKIKKLFYEEDLIDALKNKINFYLVNQEENHNIVTTHLTFYNFDNSAQFSVNDFTNMTSSIADKGLLSELSYTKSGLNYSSGFGLKDLEEKNDLINSSMLWNSFIANNLNNRLNPYRKNESLVNNVVSIDNKDIDHIFEKTHWVTFIDPAVDLSFFNDNNRELYVIHYNDQTSSFSYESITVTKNTKHYENILNGFLKKVRVSQESSNMRNIVRSFNILNGEWLLSIVGTRISKNSELDNIVREKLSVISAYKNVLALLNNTPIVWVPISLEEILRVSRQQGLDSTSDLFSTKELEHKGSISDDLLFIGLELKENNKYEFHLMPVEVKVGENKSGVRKKAHEQIEHLNTLLKSQLIDQVTDTFNQNYYKYFFANLYFGNLKKFVDNDVITKDCTEIFNAKAAILNEDITFSINQDNQDFNGIVALFTKDNHIRRTEVNDEVLELILTEDDAYNDAGKDFYELITEFEEDKKGFLRNHITSINYNDYSIKTSFENNSDIKADSISIGNGDVITDSLNNVQDETNSSSYVITSDLVKEKIDNNAADSFSEYEQSDNSVSKDEDLEENPIEKDTYSYPIESYSSSGINKNIDVHNFPDPQESVGESHIEEISTIDGSVNNLSSEGVDIENIRLLLGKVVGSNYKIYWEYGNYQLPNRHLLISGKSGQGKTYFMQTLLYEMSKNKLDSLVIDYSDGFLETQLEDLFKEKVDKHLKSKYVYIENISLNPFKRNTIDLGGILVEEKDEDITDRVVQIIDFVFNLGIQQNSLLKDYINQALKIYGENLTFTKIKSRILDEDTPASKNLYGRISSLLDKDPFDYSDKEFTWKKLFNFNGDINIIQLKGFTPDIQKVITEFLLWDLFNFSEREGNKNFPIPVLLDEMQNLNHKESSPTTKILKEGRKFGWSSWLATQSISSIKSNGGDSSALYNAALQIHFSPPEDQVTNISRLISADREERNRIEQQLSNLQKGQCFINGYSVLDGELMKITEVINVTPFEER